MAAVARPAARTTARRSRVKAGDPCSEAMSEWKLHGMTATIAAILGKCRAKGHKPAARALDRHEKANPSSHRISHVAKAREMNARKAKGGKLAAPKQTPAPTAKASPKKAPAKAPAAPTHSPAEVHAIAAKEKAGQKLSKEESRALNKARRAHADQREKDLAAHFNGQRDEDYKEWDVLVPKPGGKGDHAIESKSLIFGARPNLSVHENALVRKVDDAAANPGRVYHTVIFDDRNTTEGGIHAANYSGHPLYYKRAAGPYAVSKLYPARDLDHVRELMNTPDHKLPEAARGEFPKGEELAHLRQKAIAELEYNNTRSRERKKRLGAAAYGR